MKFFLRGDAVFGVFGYLCSVNHDLQIDNDVLVEECLKGDKDALNLFYVRFAPRMLGVIRRYVPGARMPRIFCTTGSSWPSRVWGRCATAAGSTTGLPR